MKQHAHFWDKRITRVIHLNPIYDFMGFYLGINIQSAESKPGRTVGDRRDDFDVASILSSKLHHSLLNEYTQIGLQIIGKQRCIDKSFHLNLLNLRLMLLDALQDYHHRNQVIEKIKGYSPQKKSTYRIGYEAYEHGIT
jgi:hypothetical protein